jgi:hypothetical protein
LAKFSDALSTLLSRCLNDEPKQRPPIGDVVNAMRNIVNDLNLKEALAHREEEAFIGYTYHAPEWRVPKHFFDVGEVPEDEASD